MILADTNVWLALTLSKHSFHRAARDWFDGQTRRTSIAFCRSTQQSFLRLLTTEATLRPYGLPPMTNDAAWAVYDALLADRRVTWAAEPSAADVEGHWKHFAAHGMPFPKMWMDAYLAAFAIAARCRFVTTDKAFQQFAGLDLIVLPPAPPKA